MRDIEFHARNMNGLWITFTPLSYSKEIDGKIEESTICQFTGMRDSKVVRLYEGDIVRFSYANPNEKPKLGVISYDEATAQFVVSNPQLGIPAYPIGSIPNECILAWGNQWDDPELLEGEEE